MTDSNDEYTKQRDAAAEVHANKNGLVDPAKFYSFCLGADWGYERGKSEGKAPPKYNNLILDKMYEALICGDSSILVIDPKEVEQLRQQLEAANVELEIQDEKNDQLAKEVIEAREEIEKLKIAADQKEFTVQNTFNAWQTKADELVIANALLKECECALEKYKGVGTGPGFDECDILIFPADLMLAQLKARRMK